jgi:hypothetical protein
MRKCVIGKSYTDATAHREPGWLEIQKVAPVEVSSEDPNFPIESVFISDDGPGWRAAQQGAQLIRLIFDEPQTLHRIRLQFFETQIARTQEFTLRWSNTGRTFREIVRQQWYFSPAGSTSEIEDYQVSLNGVCVLELAIDPNIQDGKAVATLGSWRVA